MRTNKNRTISLFLTLAMIASSLCFLALSSNANDLNEPVEYRDEEGLIIGEEQRGKVPYAGKYTDYVLNGCQLLPSNFVECEVEADGEKEEIYDDALKGKISLLSGDTAEQYKLWGDVWFLHNESYLYVYVEAHDDEVFDIFEYITICPDCGKQRGRNTGCEHISEPDYDARVGEETVDIHMDDCIELYIDWKNDGSEPTEYRISRSGVASRGYDTWDLGFEAGSKSGENVWYAEFAIPMPDDVSDGAGVNVVIHSQNSLNPFSETSAFLNNYNCVAKATASEFYDFIEFGSKEDKKDMYIELPFIDIEPSSWYFEAVKWTYENNIFNGMEYMRFAPQANMTRAMFATVLYRMAGEPEVTGEIPFTDIGEDMFYEDAVLWAYQNDVIKGISPTAFGSSAFITREQLVTLLYRYTVNGGNESSNSADLGVYIDGDKVSEYAKYAMSWAVGAGIIQGNDVGGDCYLDPQGSATRAQVATVLMRYYLYLSQIS